MEWSGNKRTLFYMNFRARTPTLFLYKVPVYYYLEFQEMRLSSLDYRTSIEYPTPLLYGKGSVAWALFFATDPVKRFHILGLEPFHNSRAAPLSLLKLLKRPSKSYPNRTACTNITSPHPPFT